MTSFWMPRLVCPECGGRVGSDESRRPGCCGCGYRHGLENGIYRFLAPERLAMAAPFLAQYRAVRAIEGYRRTDPDYYRRLPSVAADDPHASEWRIRSESFERLHRALPPGRRLRVLDLGAGNGWLSHRLSAMGHQTVAVDRSDDENDGLGACRHYETSFARIQADFDALPFAAGQFDLVIFNGSLHYAPDVGATLARARRMLTAGGALAVMDSPMFHDDRDGHAMVAEKLRRFRTEYGLTDIVHPSVGFLTPTALALAAAPLGLTGRFFQSRGPLRWRVGRGIAQIRLRRAPAAFGVWLAHLGQAVAP